MAPRFQSTGAVDTTRRGAPWVVGGGELGVGEGTDTIFFFCNSAERKLLCVLSEWISLF